MERPEIRVGEYDTSLARDAPYLHMFQPPLGRLRARIIPTSAKRKAEGSGTGELVDEAMGMVCSS
jgi:hypothetical protein